MVRKAKFTWNCVSQNIIINPRLNMQKIRIRNIEYAVTCSTWYMLAQTEEQLYEVGMTC